MSKDEILKKLSSYTNLTNFDVFMFDSQNFVIEPICYKGDKLDGMTISLEDGIYEVFEIQAGKNHDELRVYFRSKSLKRAVNNMLKGNDRPKHKCIEIWR